MARSPAAAERAMPGRSWTSSTGGRKAMRSGSTPAQLSSASSSGPSRGGPLRTLALPPRSGSADQRARELLRRRCPRLARAAGCHLVDQGGERGQLLVGIGHLGSAPYSTAQR